MSSFSLNFFPPLRSRAPKAGHGEAGDRLPLESSCGGGSWPAVRDYVYDGGQPPLESSCGGGSWPAVRDYVDDDGQPYLWHEGGYTVIDNRDVHADRLGSVAATTNASGAVTAYADGPYGEAQTWAKANQRRRRAVELGAIGIVSTYSTTVRRWDILC